MEISYYGEQNQLGPDWINNRKMSEYPRAKISCRDVWNALS